VFEIDLEARELRRSGARLHLEPQPFAALALLVSCAGEMVSRQSMREHIWGDNVSLSFDHGLNYCLRQVRIALDDKPRSARYIETLPGRGYRFIAPVEEISSTDAPRPQEAARAEPPATPARLDRIRTAGVALVAAGALAAVWSAGSAADSVTPRRPIRVLVLPFSDPGQSDPGPLPTGLADQTIDDLARDATRVAVLARTTALAWRASPERADEAGRRAAADYVLDGRVRREGDLWHVQARWVRSSGGASVWAESFAGRADALPALRDEVARAAGRALLAHLGAPPGRASEAHVQSGVADLDDDLLLARYRLLHGGPRAALDAVQACQRVVRRAPAHAPGWSCLAEAWATAARSSVSSPREALPRAAEAARRALELDPRAASARLALAQARLHLDWDVPAAQVEFDRALDLAPGAASVHHARAAAYAASGQAAAAVASVERASRLDPLNREVALDSGWYAYLARLHNDAARHYERALRLEPGNVGLHAQALLNDLAGGRPAAAHVDALLRSAGLPPERVRAIPARDAIARILDARARRLEQARAAHYVGADEIAVAFACKGDHQSALAWLERAAEERAYWLLPTLAAEPCLAPLRDSPRLAALLVRTGQAKRLHLARGGADDR
jgi:DNA-binding winged helix-turn-helix (wHTH) protein/tetratricopeptide (TPR) repeat protein